MSDLSVTAASVVPGANAKLLQGKAGATITAGQAVYFDAATGSYKLADANASAITANCAGIAINGASSGQPLTVDWDDDDFTPGATLSISAGANPGIYCLSATPGGICPLADLASGMYPVVLLVAKSSSKARLKIANGAAALTA